MADTPEQRAATKAISDLNRIKKSYNFFDGDGPNAKRARDNLDRAIGIATGMVDEQTGRAIDGEQDRYHAAVGEVLEAVAAQQAGGRGRRGAAAQNPNQPQGRAGRRGRGRRGRGADDATPEELGQITNDLQIVENNVDQVEALRNIMKANPRNAAGAAEYAERMIDNISLDTERNQFLNNHPAIRTHLNNAASAAAEMVDGNAVNASEVKKFHDAVHAAIGELNTTINEPGGNQLGKQRATEISNQLKLMEGNINKVNGVQDPDVARRARAEVNPDGVMQLASAPAEDISAPAAVRGTGVTVAGGREV